MIGLKELTVRGAKSFAELRAKHKWNVSADYNVAIDCLDRHTELRDKLALLYEDDEGHTARYTFAQMIEASNRFANALRGIGIHRGDVVAVHTPQRPETAIAHMALYRLGAIALPISKLFGPDAIQYRLDNSSAKAILMEPETVGKMDAVDRKSLPNFKHVIVTSNLPFDEWTGVFASERLTGALLDRLTHHVHILELNGDSFRLMHSKRRISDDQPPTVPG